MISLQPDLNIQHRTSKTELEGEGGAKRVRGKKGYGSPANKGDFVINNGYTPGYHRTASGTSPAQHGARKRMKKDE
jgi:hypothetical protein